MHKIRLVSALLIGVTSVYSPASSALADPGDPPNTSTSGIEIPGRDQPPAKAPDGPFTSAEGCDDIATRLPALAAAGKKTVSCVGKSEKPSEEARSAQRKLNDLDIGPDWCQTLPIGGYWYDRENICAVTDWFLQVRNSQTGAVTGDMQFLVYDVTTTLYNSSSWSQELNIYPYSMRGTAVGTNASLVSAACTGNCYTSEASFPPVILVTGRDHLGRSAFQTNISASGSTAKARGQTTIALKPPASGNLVHLVMNPPYDVRCDNAVPGISFVGCTIPDYEPNWDVIATGFPTFIRHMQSAHDAGLHGFTDSNTPLTRLTDPVLREENGKKACPDLVSWPRPPGHSCDEYPFRSTHQGAYTGGGTGRTFDWCQITALPTGVTGPNGYSSCMIDAGENSTAGSLLNNFYIYFRVIEKDPFYVWLD